MEHRLMFDSDMKVVLIHIHVPHKIYQKNTGVIPYEIQAFDEDRNLIASVVDKESPIKARMLLMEKLNHLGYSNR